MDYKKWLLDNLTFKGKLIHPRINNNFSWVKKENEEVFQWLMEQQEKYLVTKKELLYKILVEETEHFCLSCGAPVKLKNFTTGYRVYCSSKCSNSDKLKKEKTRKIKKEKYGNEDYLNVEKSKEYKITEIWGCVL